jgi:predicted GTPase
MSTPSRFEGLRDEIATVLAELVAAAHKRGATATLDRLNAAGQRLREAPLTVVVCGEFKRGKSSLLNALLEEQPPLFPVNARVATSVVTAVSYAAEESIDVTLDTGTGVETRRIARAEIADYATEAANPDNAKRARAIEVRTPNQRLAGGLRIVDTPGVGGVFADHTAVTMGFLPRADAIVFVCDFTQPLLASELEFLRQAAQAASVAGDLGALLFVVTKADLAGAGERAEMMANTTAKLAAVTGEAAETLTVVPVSSLAKLDYLADGDPQDLADSGFEQLDAELAATVERRRAKLILGTALADADAAAQALLRPLDDERAALEAGTKQKLAELRAQAAQRQSELAALGKSQAGWRAELARGMQGIGRDLQREARRRLADVWHRCDNEYLYNQGYLDDPDQLVERLVADVALIAGSLGELAENRAAEVMREFARTHGLELDHPAIGALPPPRVPSITVTGGLGQLSAEGRGWEKVKQFSQGGGVGATIGSIVGGLIGMIGGPPGATIGAFIGGSIAGLAGGTRSVKTAVQRQRHHDAAARRHSIRAELAPLRSSQQFDMDENLEVLVHNLVIGVAAELDSRIAQEQESLADATARLGEAQKATASEATARRAELDREKAPLVRARDRITRIAARTARLGERLACPAPTAHPRPAPVAAAPSPAAAGDESADWADD